MEAAAQVRGAMIDAVADVTPTRLRELIEARLEQAAMTPGVVVIESARAGRPSGRTEPDGIVSRGAGVQLIYEGLALTRSLVRSPPWPASASVDANMDVLMADVLVARGFYLLARTEAAPTAVEVVRSFGRDETLAETAPADEPPIAALETDIFELAIVAGLTAVDAEPPPDARAFVSDIAGSFRTNGTEPLSESTIEALRAFLDGAESPETPVEEGWAQTGSTDG